MYLNDVNIDPFEALEFPIWLISWLFWSVDYFTAEYILQIITIQFLKYNIINYYNIMNIIYLLC